MNKRNSLRLLQSLSLLILLGCVETEQKSDNIVAGYKPVYSSSDSEKITWQSPHPVKDPGRIYLYGEYLLINEVNAGIHVFDNTDPKDPKPLGFIQMLGNTDMAISDNVLYADHAGDLVALTIQDLSKLREEGRLPLHSWTLGLPPPAGAAFECVDSGKGYVVAWQKAQLKNPQCYAML
jgi:hypothetical protein